MITDAGRRAIGGGDGVLSGRRDDDTRSIKPGVS
jgi:hypothetical protein